MEKNSTHWHFPRAGLKEVMEHLPQGLDTIIEEISDEDGWKVIRDTLSYTAGMGGIPYVRVIDLNKKDNTLTLENIFDGRALDLSYAKETLKYIQELWGYDVKLITKGTDKQEIVIKCDQDKKLTIL